VLLIREGPATELTVATRILAHLGLLGADGRVALRVGSDVVYLAGRGVRPPTMTPYDLAAVRLADGLELAGTPPEDAAQYLVALRADRGARVAARTPDGQIVTADGVVELVERLSRLGWSDAEARARAAGGLVGAYPAEPSD
jgi:hypothetical protein